MYFTKIAWSFCIRINKNHELLIIHGKYLERMLVDEGHKVSEKKYIPPDLNKNMKNMKKDKELINLTNTEEIIEEEIFVTNKKKFFRKF